MSLPFVTAMSGRQFADMVLRRAAIQCLLFAGAISLAAVVGKPIPISLVVSDSPESVRKPLRL